MQDAEHPEPDTCFFVLSLVRIGSRHHYDLFRLVRIRGNRFATAAADTLFGAIAIGITAGALLYCDHGKIRFFTLFAIAAGALLWQILPGKLLRIMIMKLKRSIGH